jgi:uncharacterized protein (TIGR00251 family)
MPSPLPGFIHPAGDGFHLRLRVQPRAKRNAIAAPEGDQLKVWVTSPPVDDAANEAVCRLLAERLKCRRGDIRIVQGRSSRHKRVAVEGLSAEVILTRLRTE